MVLHRIVLQYVIGLLFCWFQLYCTDCTKQMNWRQFSCVHFSLFYSLCMHLNNLLYFMLLSELSRWSSVMSPVSSTECPVGRHSHSAVVHQQRMWIYGGLSGLAALDDLWTWYFGKHFSHVCTCAPVFSPISDVFQCYMLWSRAHKQQLHRLSV